MNDQNFCNWLQITEFVLQILTLAWASSDSTNNEIMQELQKQNKEYLETIIEQNKKILEYLSNKD